MGLPTGKDRIVGFSTVQLVDGHRTVLKNAVKDNSKQ
jgi:hypothetical protein